MQGLCNTATGFPKVQDSSHDTAAEEAWHLILVRDILTSFRFQKMFSASVANAIYHKYRSWNAIIFAYAKRP